MMRLLLQYHGRDVKVSEAVVERIVRGDKRILGLEAFARIKERRMQLPNDS
jgi:hypothetical protein